MNYDSTLFVALHGECSPHPWREPESAASDAYSLFVARSSAMEWLADAAGRHNGGLWGMNDAGEGRDAGSIPPRMAWFQVASSTRVGAEQPLAVQTFLACAGQVMDRLGTWRLDALQLLLPVQSLVGMANGSARERAVMSLLLEAGWFADRDPSTRTQVTVTLDGGQDAAIQSAAADMHTWIRELRQDVFECGSFSSGGDHGTLLAPVIDELWLGPPQHRATFQGSLAEWSLDGLGWLAALLAEAGCRYRVNTPLLLTARPSAVSTLSNAPSAATDI